MSNYKQELYEDDDILTIEEFRECCENGSFIDYDGYGHPVKDFLVDESIDVYPSNLSVIPSDATHIVWYNR